MKIFSPSSRKWMWDDYLAAFLIISGIITWLYSLYFVNHVANPYGLGEEKALIPILAFIAMLVVIGIGAIVKKNVTRPNNLEKVGLYFLLLPISLWLLGYFFLMFTFGYFL